MHPGTKTLTKNSALIGLLGAISLHIIGFLLYKNSLIDTDIHYWGHTFKLTLALAAISTVLAAGIIMFVLEFINRLYYEQGKILEIHPALRAGKYFTFIVETGYYLLGDILILFTLYIFYSTAQTYIHQEKYKNWLEFLPGILNIYIILLIPYTFLTRALQYNKELDKKEYIHLFTYLILKLLQKIASLNKRLTSQLIMKIESQQYDYKNALLSLFVKAFFIPLMTIFFIDQFTSLQKNYHYFFEEFDSTGADYTAAKSIKDIYNLTFTFIFIIDVGIAWGGYVLTSRWIKNGIKSVEPTVMGWAVALMCYPPYSAFLHFYYSSPNDKDFINLPSSWFVAALACLSLLSYFLYMLGTASFGLRFSNLTNRGIITRGPYRFIRHPSYAGKNISWWFIMFPYSIYQVIHTGSLLPLTGIAGLVLMTTLYYYRAITEERHLSADPEYIEYMAKVKYRFIPGVF